MSTVIAGFITSLIPLGWFSSWLESITVDVHEGEMWPDFKWFLRYRVEFYDGFEAPQWVLKIPSYEWGPVMSFTSRYGWLQRAYHSRHGWITVPA